MAKLGEGCVAFSISISSFRSYGSVFKALDKSDGKIVAIKVLEVENEDVTDLKKEIAILSQCNSPYIVSYKGCWESEGRVWV